jgi:exopolysaccharide biosynthesis polyprenyl glycosylphosphotransferase
LDFLFDFQRRQRTTFLSFMLFNRSTGIKGLCAFFLLALVTLSFWSWLFIWQNDLFSDKAAVEKYFFYNEFLLIGILFRLDGRRLSQGFHHGFEEAVRRSGRQAVTGLFSVFVILFALQDTFISRTFLFSYIPWLCLTLAFANYLVPRWLSQWIFDANRPERVALAGTPEQAVKIKPWLDRKSLIGMQAIGVICLEPVTPGKTNGHNPEFPVLGILDESSEIFRKESISQLIVMDLSIGTERLKQLTQLCEGAAVRLLAVDNFDNYFNHTTMVFEDDGMRLIGLREEPLESPVNRLSKRALDLAIATPIVLFLLPFITLLVWLCQRWQSPGPVLYKQKRNGLLGQTFMIYKYRTMHINNDDEARQAAKNDRRIFPAGGWMRKLSIDELPQFINVFLGEMSVVGPRPHMLQHDDLFVKVMRNYMVRRFVHPGITGWAQVSGYRGEILSEQDIRNRVEADIYYLERWSFSLDCLIILKTIKQCVIPLRTAY